MNETIEVQGAMNNHRHTWILFAGGEYAAGALVGTTTAAAVRALIDPECDMVVAMLLGMGIGMVIHFAVTLVLGPVLGMFQVMVPGSLIGMYGGMMFAMRDTMQHPGSTSRTVGVGLVFGLVVVACVRLYDRALRSAGPSRG